MSIIRWIRPFAYFDEGQYAVVVKKFYKNLPWNIRCDYQLARLRADPAALALYRFILGDVGQGYLRQAGFMPFSDAA